MAPRKQLHSGSHGRRGSCVAARAVCLTALKEDTDAATGFERAEVAYNEPQYQARKRNG